MRDRGSSRRPQPNHLLYAARLDGVCSSCGSTRTRSVCVRGVGVWESVQRERARLAGFAGALVGGRREHLQSTVGYLHRPTSQSGAILDDLCQPRRQRGTARRSTYGYTTVSADWPLTMQAYDFLEQKVGPTSLPEIRDHRDMRRLLVHVLGCPGTLHRRHIRGCSICQAGIVGEKGFGGFGKGKVPHAAKV